MVDSGFEDQFKNMKYGGWGGSQLTCGRGS